MSLEEYAAAFTSAFRGYRYPIALDATGLARRVRVEQYALDLSVIAYDEAGEAAGVAALAVRGESAWVAGLAVVPEQRGRGRGGELMSALVARARGAGLRRLSLEVLKGNEAARRLYEAAGMSARRDLLLLDRAAGRNASQPDAAAEPLRDAPPAALLEHFGRLHRVAPAWPRDLPCLLAKENLRGLCLGRPERPEAYALLMYGRDGNTYVFDLAADTEEHAARLTQALAALPGTLKVVNEPEHSLFIRPLLAGGFVETERQHEMLMTL